MMVNVAATHKIMSKSKRREAGVVGDDVDYLAPAQLGVDPDAFQQVVREAFRLEHDCVHSQDIADVLGVDKSRVSQIFKHPEALKAETIQRIVHALNSAVHRKRIIRAWMRACFGSEFDDRSGAPRLGAVVTAQTLRQIDRQIREFRLTRALETVAEALLKVQDELLRELVLDRSFYLQLRLGLPGQAMNTARTIAESGRQLNEQRRRATGFMLRSRILISMQSAEPAQVESSILQLEEQLGGCQPISSPQPPYLLATDSAPKRLRENALLTFAERGKVRLEELELRAILEVHLDAARKSQPYQKRFGHLHVAARVHMLLNEPFQAQELIERSFKSGELKNLQALEVCGLLEARALRSLEPSRDTITRYERLAQNCLASQDFQHLAIAECERAHLESAQFS
jgi:hypothetical protein